MKGKTLKQVRLSKGLLQVDLAIKAGISASFYSMIENSLKVPSMKVANSICSILGISLDSFYDFIILNRIK